MKATFAKILSLMLVLMLALSACNLIEIDPVMQAEEDIAELEKQYGGVAASYDGGEITIGEAIGEFNAAYNEMSYYYQMYFGMEMSAEEIHDLEEEALAQMVRMEVVEKYFDEQMEMSEEALAEVEKHAQEEYQLSLESALEVAEGKTDEAKNASAGVLLKANGWDYDSIYRTALLRAKLGVMEQSLRDEITGVSEEELIQAYEARVMENEEYYVDGYSLESDMSTEGVRAYWFPEGYRTVKHILLRPADELLGAYNDAVYALEDTQYMLSNLDLELADRRDDDSAILSMRGEEEIEAEIEMLNAEIPGMEAAVEAAARACVEDVRSAVDAIYERLAAGEDFDSLIKEYGEDPGMQSEPAGTSGYYVSAASRNWESNFRDAAMALEKAGDYSPQPVVSGSGVHIIRYESDVVPGAVPLDEVRDALYEETLISMQDAHCEETIAAWVDAVHPVYDLEVFETAFAAE